jgi:hypothetical protein
MAEKIYEIDIDQEFGPEDVKQAIMRWFLSSHKELLRKRANQTGIEGDNEDYTLDQVQYILKMQFQRNNYDFNKPTKEGLFYVTLSLIAIAKSFNDVDIICNNLIKIMTLIDKLPCDVNQ